MTLLEGWSIVEANDIADLGKLFQSWTDLNVNHITPVFDEDFCAQLSLSQQEVTDALRRRRPWKAATPGVDGRRSKRQFSVNAAIIAIPLDERRDAFLKRRMRAIAGQPL